MEIPNMKDVYIFNNVSYETYEEAYDEAICYARETFDNYLDECYDEVRIGSTTYPASYVLKRVNDTDYRMLLCDYEYRIVEEITEDEIDDEEEEDEDEDE